MSNSTPPATSADLLKLIREYQLHVLGTVNALRSRYGVEDLLRGRREGMVPERGTLDDRHESRFTFHGVGCCVESENGVVDFDFGPGSKRDGFDGWRLWTYTESIQESDSCFPLPLNYGEPPVGDSPV